MIGRRFTSQLTGEVSLIVQQELCRKWGETITEVKENLLNEAQQPIENALYSRYFNQKWVPFSERDLERINNLFAQS